MINPSVGWVITSRRIFRSTDAGAHWSDVTPSVLRAPQSESTQLAGFALDANVAWLAVNHPDATTVYRTTDGGTSWASSLAPVVGTGYRVATTFVDEQYGWVSNDIGGCGLGSCGMAIAQTTDGGLSWREISSTFDRIPLNCRKTSPVFVDRSRGWIGGACTGNPGTFFLATNDGGRSWSRPSLPLPIDFSPIGFWQMTTSAPEFLNPREGFFSATLYTPEAVLDLRYTTRDAGTTWRLENLVLPRSGVVTFTDPACRLPIEDSVSAILDPSRTSQVLPPTPSSADCGARRLDVFWLAGTDSSFLWKTTNGGRSWTSVGSQDPK